MEERFAMTACRLLVVAVAGAGLYGCATSEETLARRIESLRIPAAPLPSDRTSGPLTLAQAIERAILYSEEVSVMRAQDRIAAEQQLAASDFRDPVIGVSYSENESDSADTRWDYGFAGMSTQAVRTTSRKGDSYAVSVRFYPDNPFERHYRISAAAGNSRAATLDEQVAEWAVAAEVKRLFAQLDYGEKDLRILSELVDVHEKAAKATKELVRRGAATSQDQMTASRRYLSAVSEKNKVTQDCELARETLANYLGLSAGTVKVLVNETTFPKLEAETLKVEELTSLALSRRADLAALSWRAAAAKSAYHETLSTRVPWLNDIRLQYAESTSTQDGALGANVLGLNPADPLSQDEQDGTSWRVDATINIPLFSWGNHDSDVRLAEYHQARNLLQDKRDRISRDVKNTVEALRSSQKASIQYRAEIAPIVYDMQEVVENATESGGLPPSEIARIKQEILDTQRLRLQTEYQQRLAVIRLEEVISAPLRVSTGR